MPLSTEEALKIVVKSISLMDAATLKRLSVSQPPRDEWYEKAIEPPIDVVEAAHAELKRRGYRYIGMRCEMR